MSKRLIAGMIVLVSILALYSGCVMNEKFSFVPNLLDTKTTGISNQ